MKILAIGGGDFTDRGRVRSVLGLFQGPMTLVVLRGPGLSEIAKEEASALGWHRVELPALEDVQDNAPDAIVAFEGWTASAYPSITELSAALKIPALVVW